jgi:hypothetical protein
MTGAFFTLTYLERQSFVHGGKSPSSLVPCLKSIAFLPLPSPHSHTCFPTNRTFIYVQTTLTRRSSCRAHFLCPVDNSLCWLRHKLRRQMNMIDLVSGFFINRGPITLQGPEEFILGIIFRFKEIFQHESQFTGSEPPRGIWFHRVSDSARVDSYGFQAVRALNFRRCYQLEANSRATGPRG